MESIPTSTTQEMTASSIELARAVADYGALVTIAGVFMLLVLILFCYFVYQLFVTTKKVDKIAAAVAKVTDFFSDKSMRMVNIDQARAIVSNEFNRAAAEVALQVIKIKNANHLDDREAVERNVATFLNRLYASNVGFMRKFEYEGQALSAFLESTWKDAIAKRMLDDCTIHEYNVNRLEDSYRDLFNGFKGTFNQKIDDIQYK